MKTLNSKEFSIERRKNSSFTVVEPGKNCSRQVIKVNTNSDYAEDMYCCYGVMKMALHLSNLPLKLNSPSLIIKKTVTS